MQETSEALGTAYGVHVRAFLRGIFATEQWTALAARAIASVHQSDLTPLGWPLHIMPGLALTNLGEYIEEVAALALLASARAAAIRSFLAPPAALFHWRLLFRRVLLRSWALERLRARALSPGYWAFVDPQEGWGHERPHVGYTPGPGITWP